MVRRVLLAVAIAVVLSSILVGCEKQPAGWDEGVAAFKRGDYATALQEFRVLAEQGDAGAQVVLGTMYTMGRAVLQDDAKAAKWYQKSGLQGNAVAQSLLGAAYRTGLGVPQDDVRAHMWLNLAASSLPPGKDRDDAVKNRDMIAKRMTPADISKAQRLAREWMEKHPKR